MMFFVSLLELLNQHGQLIDIGDGAHRMRNPIHALD